MLGFPSLVWQRINRDLLNDVIPCINTNCKHVDVKITDKTR